ncbi:hypothetical protein [Phaeobacter sp. LSS9]|uniref:hypothetical protein n=1 Tax=unclassified Phaeobacter TaxID=2621772 RepID=UPI0013C2FC00|nr:hypothetical protein [Phaeobacter sp. LSS9]
MPTTNMTYPFKIGGEHPRLFIGPIRDNWRKSAESKGFVVLGRGGEGHQTLVLGCRACGEPLLRRTNVVLGNRIECRSCIQRPYEIAAERIGARMIAHDPEGDRHYRIWQLSCGHTVRLQLGQMLKVGQGLVDVDCVPCRHKRYASEAAAHGWSFLDASSSQQSYARYRHKCGFEHEVHIGNMRVGQCACPECGPRTGPVSSGIYIFRIDLPGLPVVKLGHSHRHLDRLHRDLKIAPSVHTEVLRYHPMRTKYLARTQEESAHDFLKSQHPEWVVSKHLYGDAIAVKSEIYRPEALPTIHRLLDEIAARHLAPAPSPDTPA